MPMRNFGKARGASPQRWSVSAYPLFRCSSAAETSGHSACTSRGSAASKIQPKLRTENSRTSCRLAVRIGARIAAGGGHCQPREVVAPALLMGGADLGVGQTAMDHAQQRSALLL